ncbi:MAG: hypothetical protein AAGJ29_12290, partial [Pseudomonadota bacterium]
MSDHIYRLETEDSLFVIEAPAGAPASILWWGRPLAAFDTATFRTLTARQFAPGGPDIPVYPPLFAGFGCG